MDEVSFGPDREIRLPSRGRRALAAVLAVACAGAVAGGVRHALIAQHSAGQSAAQPAAPVHLPSKGCAPTQSAWPALTGLPPGLRIGAMPVVIDAQFSGRCPAPQHAGPRQTGP